MKNIKLVLAVASVFASVSFNTNAADCVGNCGTLGADGDITLSPTGNNYTWISTNLGQLGGGTLPGFEGTNGSSFTTDAFFAKAGAKVEYYFNYVTSDGSGFADYAWSQLQGATKTTIFTARTKPEGNIVPGQDLPPVQAILNPSIVQIIPGGPVWSPLGNTGDIGGGDGDGGDIIDGPPVLLTQLQVNNNAEVSAANVTEGPCFAAGCGYTGWVKSTYTITEEGTYKLAFGVTNFADTAFDSGLAFDGLLLNGVTIGDGSSADNALLPKDIIQDDGSFIFEFTATPNEMVFIDPEVAIGYNYKILNDNAFKSVLLPNIGDGIFTVSGTYASGTSFSVTVNDGEEFLFAESLFEFAVSGIETSANLDPTNPAAFVTGLTFLKQGLVQVSQTPITEFIGVSEVPIPAAAPLMLSALGLFGFARRKKA